MYSGKIIKRLKLYGFLFILLHLAEAKVYTLDELIEVAIRNSKDLRIIELEIQKAETEVQDIVGSAMPLITASVNLSHSIPFDPYKSFDDISFRQSLFNVLSDSISGVIPADLTGFASSIMTKSSLLNGRIMQFQDNAATGTITLNQPIYAQGKTGLGIKIARAYQRTLLCKYQTERLKLKASMTRMFYQALLAQKNVEIAREAVLLSEQTHRLTLITYALGKVSELDTLNSLFALEKSKIDLKKVQSDLLMVYETIIIQAALIENAQSMSVEGEFPQDEFKAEIDLVLEKVRKNNPDLEQLRGGSEIRDLRIQLAKCEFYPSVYAGASLGGMGLFDHISNVSNTNWGTDHKFFIGVNWNIFTGLRRNQKVAQAEIERELFQISEQKIFENMELQTRKAFDQVTNSFEQLHTFKSLQKIAEKGLEIAKKAYEVGSKTLLDVQNAEHQLNSAKVAFNAAQYNYHIAIINLKLLMSDL
ncbi:MAG: TolC family protein [Fibrobacter sp.]|nr:TolC family protein [Fibrobacter sp.]